MAPYSYSRFDALARSDGVHLTVVEISDTMHKYPWSKLKEGSFDRLTLFHGIGVEELDAAVVSSKLVSLLDEMSPNVCVVSGYSDSWNRLCAIHAKNRGAVSLSTFDSTERDRPRNRFVETMKGLMMRTLFNGVSYAGLRSRQYLLKLGFDASRMKSCSNVVDNEHFARRPTTWKATLPKEPFFLSVSRFSPEKNLLLLMDSYEKYACRNQRPWSLAMVGSGPQESEIRKRAACFKRGNVVFPGFFGYDLLPETYQRSECLVLPSVSEPWGLVVNEAMAAGTPVIVSEPCGCVPELVMDGENGFVFDPTDSDALTVRMEEISSMSKEQRRDMGRRGQEIISTHTPKTWAENVLSLIERCKK